MGLRKCEFLSDPVTLVTEDGRELHPHPCNFGKSSSVKEYFKVVADNLIVRGVGSAKPSKSGELAFGSGDVTLLEYGGTRKLLDVCRAWSSLNEQIACNGCRLTEIEK